MPSLGPSLSPKRGSPDAHRTRETGRTPRWLSGLRIDAHPTHLCIASTESGNEWGLGLSLTSEEGQSFLLGLYLGSDGGQEQRGPWTAFYACAPDFWGLADRGPRGRSVGLPVLGCSPLLLPYPEPSEPQVGCCVWEPGVCGVFGGFVPPRKWGPKGGSSSPKEGPGWISTGLRGVTSAVLGS